MNEGITLQTSLLAIKDSTLDMACFKYKFLELNHVHLAVIDCWDVYASVMIRADQSGGTWKIEHVIPVLHKDLPEFNLRAVEKPEATAKRQLAYLKSIVRNEQKNMDIVQLDTCDKNGGKIIKSFAHLLFNQQTDLFNPNRDGWTPIV